MKNYGNKRLIVFDLDGTLAPSKSFIDREMANFLLRLLETKKIAVIGGGKYLQFKEQLLERLPHKDARLKNLFIFPTTSNAFYRYRGGWKNVYARKLSRQTKMDIKNAFKQVLQEIQYIAPEKTYGVVLEDRSTQMSFSPLGQDVVAKLGNKGIRMKEEWKKKNNPLRIKITRLLAKRLPKLEVKMGGLTTIDITPKGIDKAYGIRQIKKILKIPVREMVFIGDALYPGGNDYAAKKTGVECIPVRGPEDTKRAIEKMIAN